MSMAWMPMCGQTWLDSVVSFVGLWVVMMVTMMLPSLMPTLWRYRQALGATGAARLHWLIAPVGVGYLFVWTLCGLCVYPLGVGLSAVEMQVPALAHFEPMATGLVVLIAGAVQLTAWKARRLACCRAAPWHHRGPPTDAGGAWRHGIRHGLRCVACCAGPTATLHAIGIMDLRAMAVVTTARILISDLLT